LIVDSKVPRLGGRRDPVRRRRRRKAEPVVDGDEPIAHSDEGCLEIVGNKFIDQIFFLILIKFWEKYYFYIFFFKI
jgi:hypothetical protein